MYVKNPVKIDKDKCIGCALCVDDCPNHSLKIVNGKAEFVSESCLECGHCYAICPKAAVDMVNLDTSDCTPVVPMTELGSDKLLTAMKSRRTIRRFNSKPVEEEKIAKILEVGRCCQTGTNSQNVAYTILGSKQAEIEKECVKMFRTGVKVASPFVKEIKGQAISDSFFFRKAPLVIVVSSPSKTNGCLATAYMELMAESLGLGVLISGFTEICANANPKIKSMLKLPKGHKVVAVMVIGYTDIKYQRTAPRRKLQAKTL